MIINNSHLCSTFDHKAYYKQLCIYASIHTRAEPVSQHSTGLSILIILISHTVAEVPENVV